MKGNQRPAVALLPLGILVLAMLACGGFQVRVTPTVGPTKTATKEPTKATIAATATEALLAPVRTPTAAAQAATATPAPEANKPALTPGGSARISADTVNVRAEAKAQANKVGTLTGGTVVSIKGGPVVADNYTWYQIDDGAGVTGWVASGPAEAPWLSPEAVATTKPGPRLVDRPIKVGDLVQVTTKQGQALTVRDNPSTSGTEMAKAMPGTQFTVKGGPTKQDNFVWWQVEGEDMKGWIAEGDAETRWLTPVEQ